MLQIYTSKQHSNDGWLKATEVELTARSGFAGNSIYVDSSKSFQEILGFGGALTEATTVTLDTIDRITADQWVEAYYSPNKGHRYTFCRIHLNSCDFSLGNYSSLETEGDRELASFQIERFSETILPWLKRIRELAGEDLKILVSPWSPPAWMKTTKQMNRGGRLLPEWRRTWAQCYARFAQALAAEGLPVWGFTVQNEPDAVQTWESCLYSAEEERDFVRDHLGPVLEEAGLGHIKIIIWDHNRDQLVHRAAVVYDDPDASRYVWGSGFHWYMDPCHDNVKRHKETWPEKGLLFTEGCQECGTHIGSFGPAERYARSIIADLNNGANGWIDWNLVLNEAGGPNHVGNFCSAPLLVDRETKQVHPQPSFHYLKHFSQFIHPGAKRVLCAIGNDTVKATAARNPDGSTVVVAFNDSAVELPIKCYFRNEEASITLAPHSLSTIVLPAVH